MSEHIPDDEYTFQDAFVEAQKLDIPAKMTGMGLRLELSATESVRCATPEAARETLQQVKAMKRQKPVSTEGRRQAELLKEAATAFEEGIDPFSTSWLDEHRVTLNECLDLGQSIGSIIKGYLASPPQTRTAIHARAILSEVGLADVVELAMEKLRVMDAMKSLEK